MRNLITFIRRYFNFFLFLALEIFCLVNVFKNNDYQHTAYLNSSNAVSGYLFNKYNFVQYYFHLKATNDSLAAENARLKNELSEDFDYPDTANQVIKDTLHIISQDTLLHRRDSMIPRKYLYMEAKVVNSSVNKDMNYITIHRGRLQGIRPNMGVVSSSGVVGIVRSVSDNYAVVMSLLHKQSRLSARLRNGYTGTVIWEEGDDPKHGTLKDIPKSVAVHRGDSVFTSGFSSLFPQNLLVGFIENATSRPSSNFHTIHIRFATNFYNIQYVYIIKNLMGEEQEDLESSVPHE